MISPRVSIVVPCYNYAQYVGYAIDSCLEQTYQHFEVLVVDDASTDDSLSVVEGYRDPRVRSIALQHNHGYSVAKNIGIRCAVGDFVVHLDADDMLTPESVGVRLAAFDDEGLDFVHARAYRFKGSHSYAWCMLNRDLMDIHDRVHVHAQTWMVRRTVYERHGLYCAHMRSKSDKEILWRWGLCKGQTPRIRAKKLDDVVAFYRRHDQAMIRYRVDHPDYDAEITRLFEERQRLYAEKGVTPETVEML